MDCGASSRKRVSFWQLDAVRRLGTPEKNYPKLTFYKEHLAAATHQDADLISPGHPLFAAIAERLDAQLNEQIRTGQLYFRCRCPRALPPLLLKFR